VTKRRTRKDKEKAKHQFTISWKPTSSKIESEAKKITFEPNVKRQFNNENKNSNRSDVNLKGTYLSEKSYDLASIKKDMLRSLILATIIFASEIVLYFVWNAI